MSSGLIVALEMCAVLGVVLGFGVWELVRLRQDRSSKAEDADASAKGRSDT